MSKPAGAGLGADQGAVQPGGAGGGLGGGGVAGADGRDGGVGAPVRGAETGDPAAFLIQHQVGFGGEDGAQGGDEGGELRRVLDVAGEQDHPDGRVGAEQRGFLGPEGGAGEADDGGLHGRARGVGVRRHRGAALGA